MNSQSDFLFVLIGTVLFTVLAWIIGSRPRCSYAGFVLALALFIIALLGSCAAAGRCIEARAAAQSPDGYESLFLHLFMPLFAINLISIKVLIRRSWIRHRRDCDPILD